MKVRLWLTVSVALAIAAGAFLFAAMSRSGGSQLVIAVLPRADGVRESAPVTYRGLDIGYVEHLRIVHGQIVAELRIRRGDAMIRQDDTLHVRSIGLFGDKALDFMPGDVTAPLLTAADTLLALPR